MPVEEFDNVWKAYDVNAYKQIISKFKDILINNLKEDYFESEDEVITINNKKTKVFKHTLELKDGNLYDLKRSIIKDVNNDSELISALAKISGGSDSDMVTLLKEMEKELVKEDSEIELEIYLNKKNMTIEKIMINDDLNSISLNKISNSEYQIEDELKKEKLGYIIYKDELFELNIDSEDKLRVLVEENNFDINIKSDEIELALKQEARSSDTKITFNIISIENKINFKIDLISKSKEIEKINKFDTSQSILVENITEQESDEIMIRLFQNPSYINLYQDIISIYNKNNLIVNS